MYHNPLLDHEFLTQLMEYRQREVYARITLLTQDELPVEYIEGRVTGGSINVDGNSALRRTCNLTMVLKDKSEVNQFHWTFKSKFKLEVGLKNMIDDKYPNIIWFKQGVFILTTCNMNQTTNNYTITINGKDKMCLLNGDLGGNIPHSTDFGIEEYYDTVTGDVTYNKLLLKDIIRNAVQTYGGELPENIIINDLDDAGLELLEYRGQAENEKDLPLYLFRNIEDGQVDNVVLNEKHIIYIDGEACHVDGTKLNSDEMIGLVYADTSNILEPEISPTEITLTENGGIKYNVIKFSYGDLAGYRLTGLTYAGELKCNVGETLVSVLDKINKMLTNFEYFYNLDGKFVFQKKNTYISTPWGGQEKNNKNFINEAINDAHPKINLRNAQLTTGFANNPNILNVKNDFSVWGTYKSISGADIPIHMRYALDTKPIKYKTIRSIWTRRFDSETTPPADYEWYISLDHEEKDWMENGVKMIGTYLTKPFSTIDDGNSIVVDWREIIYQMAMDYYQHWTEDDFCQRVAAANPEYYPSGKTGYEQYYTDIQGFWRNLYDPDPEPFYEEINAKDVATNGEVKDIIYVENYYYSLKKNDLIDQNGKSIFSLHDLYTLTEIQIKNKDGSLENKLVFYPFIGGEYCHLDRNQSYWYYSGTEYKSTSDENILKNRKLDEIYVEVDGEKKLLIDVKYDNYLENYDNHSFWTKASGKKKLSDLEEQCKIVYRNGIEANTDYVQYLTRWSVLNHYGELATSENVGDDEVPQETSDRVTYLKQHENGDYNSNYWNKAILESPDQLIFWFDFLETEGSDLYKYSVREIGSRTKSINDTNVKSIYYRDVPNVIFVQSLADEVYERQPGYTYIQLPPGYSSLFSISGRGKSAKERIDELLQEHSYAIEQTNITAVPLYHLEPNTRVSVQDDMSNVDGEYIVTKVTVPLAYNGTMSLSTTKVVSNIM